MSRIGILTYHRSLNYGAVMQAYVLAEKIKERYPDSTVEIIDYSSRKMDIYYKLITLYRGKDSIFRIKDRVEMYMAFARGLKEMPLSSDRLSCDNADKFREWINSRYDVIICGSDAVWNYSKRGLPNPYFLDDIYIPHLSYAASCNGLGIKDFSEIDDDTKRYLRSAFSNFTYLGVRDEQTKALVQSVLPEAPVYMNCDPSLLLGEINEDRTRLDTRLVKKYGLDPEKPVIGLMLSNHNGSFSRMLAEKIRERYGDKYQTMALYSCNKYADIPYVADLTPMEWSTIFGMFDLTMSKYFHGTIFSLLNRTPVISLAAEKNTGGYPNKVESVLDSMDLGDLYFPAKKGEDVDWGRFLDLMDRLLTEPITDRIDKGIENEQKKSESFFEKLDKVLGVKK